MRIVTFALAASLAAQAMIWVAATNWRRFVAEGEASTTPAEAVGLSLTLLFAVGASCAFGQPLPAIAVFTLAGVLGIGAGLLTEMDGLVTLGASAALPTAGSLVSLWRRW